MAEHVVSIEIHNAVNGEQLVLGLSISDRCRFAGWQLLVIRCNMGSRSQNTVVTSLTDSSTINFGGHFGAKNLDPSRTVFDPKMFQHGRVT